MGASTGNLQQSIQLGGSIERLCFHRNPEYLETDRGPVKFGDSAAAGPSLPPQRANRLSVKDQWILRDDEKILWLPKAYRASASSVRGQTLAMGHVSGRVTIAEFDFSKMDW